MHAGEVRGAVLDLFGTLGLRAEAGVKGRVITYLRNLSVKYLLTYYYSPDHLLLRATSVVSP